MINLLVIVGLVIWGLCNWPTATCWALVLLLLLGLLAWLGEALLVLWQLMIVWARRGLQ